MPCTSGSVQKAAGKTQKAKEQIFRLEQMLQEQAEAHTSFFFDTIQSYLSEAGIVNAREISYSYDIKTEYASEFSLAAITKGIIAAFKAIEPAIKKAAMSPEAVQAYADVVNTVLQAARTSSPTCASLEFSMNRLSPGLLVFLYTSTVNIRDEDTIGPEAITSTARYYRCMQSMDDVKPEAKCGESIKKQSCKTQPG